MSILLTCAAGSMDALSLFGLGGVFASGLSGNTIVLGASLAQGESTKALLGIFIFIGYILGAALTTFLLRKEVHNFTMCKFVTPYLVDQPMDGQTCSTL